MPDVHGLVTQVQWVSRSSELTANASLGATTLVVEDATDFDNAGGDLELNGVRYEYESSDEEALTITLTTGLVAAAAVDDVVAVVIGGQVAVDYTAFVTLGEGEDVEVLIAYADRSLWPEGVYDNPVPVIMSPDLESIVSVPGRTPVINSVTYQTAEFGQRIVIRNDDSGGVIESYTGLDGETPGVYDPSTIIAGRPSVSISPGTVPTFPDRPYMEMVSGLSGGSGLAGALWRVFADRAELVSGGGFASVVCDGDTVAIRGTEVTIQSSDNWTYVSPASGFTPVVGEELRWRLDAAGHMTIDGTVTLGGAVVSGDRVFTFPSSVRRSAGIWRVPISSIPFATPTEMTVAFNGEVRVQFTGTPTTLRLCTSFSIL